jgi:hypothetical protein
MKQGMSLTDLARELERQNEAKKDYVADTSAISMANDGKTLSIQGAGSFGVTPHARRQLAEKLGIPFAYFDRLQESHPDLLATNVNGLMVREPTRNMVRTLDGNVRSFLSDRYRPLDNFDLADAVLPVLMEAKVKVESCNVTGTKLYIKALLPWLDRELPVPAGLKMGEGHNIFLRRIIGSIVISNSEVGAGALSISPGIFERQCTNLAVFKDEGYGRMHIGKKSASDDPVSAYLSDSTKRLEDAAVWAKVRDVVKATMDGKVMDSIAKKLIEARGDAIVGDPVKVVEVFAKKQGLNEGERGGLLKHLVGSGEMTRYGLQWAVTRLAGDVEDYDRASELERLGGQVIELPRSDWEVLAKAA